MPRTTHADITTKTHPAVAVYLFIAVGVIVGTVALVAYLFSGQ